MKLRTSDLRAAVDQAIVDHRDRWHRKDQARHDEYAERRAKWVADNKDAWNAACTAIREAVRKGRPVTPAMLPGDTRRGYRGSILVFDEDPPLKRTYPGPDQALVRVKNALKLITDDEVSTNTLQQLGVSPAVLRDFLALMSSGGAE